MMSEQRLLHLGMCSRSHCQQSRTLLEDSVALSEMDKTNARGAAEAVPQCTSSWESHLHVSLGVFWFVEVDHFTDRLT
jgi:hypothetical protein